MKTKQEIEKLARIYENYNPNDSEIAQAESGGCYHGYKKGYTQCQEDTEQEINRIKKIMIESSNQAMTWEEKYWQLKNSLNKQDNEK
jgi:hypothetical protein